MKVRDEIQNESFLENFTFSGSKKGTDSFHEPKLLQANFKQPQHFQAWGFYQWHSTIYIHSVGWFFYMFHHMTLKL